MDNMSQIDSDTIESSDDLFEEEVITKVAQEDAFEVTTRNLYRHPAAHPVVLDLCVTRKFGVDWLMWEAETIERGLVDVGGISQVNMAKLQACRTLHLVDTFWSQWEIFLPCCMAFNGVPPDFERMQVPTVEQCMVAVDTANRIRDGVKWSSEIEVFLDTVFRHDGIVVPQEPLTFVTVDTEGYGINVKDIKDRWMEVRLSHQAPRGGSLEDEQLRKMLDLYNHLDEVRGLLRRQLKAVLNA